MSGIFKKLVQCRNQNKKIFLKFVFFEELSRIEVLCENVIISMILVTFSVTFLQNKIILNKNINSKFNFKPQN